MSRAAQQGKLVVPAVGLALLILVLTVLSTGIVPGVPAMLRPFDLSGFLGGRAFDITGASTANQNFQIVGAISPSNIVSNDADLDRLTYAFAATIGGGQTVVGYLSPEEVSRSTPNSPAKFPFRIEAVAESNTIRYPILSERETLSTFFWYSAGGCPIKNWLTCNTDWKPCAESAEAALATSKSNIPLGYIDLACIDRVQEARVGRIDNPTIDTQAKFRVSNGREVIDRTLSTYRAPVTSGDKVGASLVAEFTGQSGLVARVSAVGGLSTGQTWNDPGSFRALYDLRDMAWRVNLDDRVDRLRESEADLVNWIKTREGDMRSNIFSATTDSSLIDSMLSNHQTLFYDTLVQREEITPGQRSTTEGGEDSGSVVYTAAPQVLRGLYQWEVKAAWLGVFIPAGKPRIVSLESGVFRAGDRGNIRATVANDAEVDAVFSVSLASCQGFSQEGPVKEVAVGARGQATTTIPILSGGPASGTCQVSACDRGRPTVCDVKSVQLQSQSVAGCVEGEQRDSVTAIDVCRNGAWVREKRCPLGVIGVSGGLLDCATLGPGPTPTGYLPAPLPTTAGGESIPPPRTCDILCRLMRVNPLVWVIIGVAASVVGGLIYATRKRR